MSERPSDMSMYDSPLSDELAKSIDEAMKNPSLWPAFVELCERLKGDAAGVETVCGLLKTVCVDRISSAELLVKEAFEEATKG